MMNKSLPSLGELTDSLTEEVAFGHRFDLNLAGCQMRVESNSVLLDAALRRYFAPFLTQVERPEIVVQVIDGPNLDLDLPYKDWAPEAGKRRIKEQTVDLPGGRAVRKMKTGMSFFFGGSINLAVGRAKENDNQVINFINNRFIEKLLNQDCILGHAAAVSFGEQGLALAGMSGAGKSTLALHLLSEGADYVSNDRLMVRSEANHLEMYGVPKLPRINPGTALGNPDLHQVMSKEEIESFSQLEGDDLWDLEHKFDVYIDRCFSKSRFVLHRPVQSLVILNWQRTDAPVEVNSVDLSKRRDLLAAFMKSPGAFFLPQDPANPPDLSEARYLSELAPLKVYEIKGGVDFKAATEACLQLVRG